MQVLGLATAAVMTDDPAAGFELLHDARLSDRAGERTGGTGRASP